MSHFNLAALRLKVEELDLKASEPDFWSDPAKSQKILQEASVYKNKLQGYEEMMRAYEDAQVMLEMAVEEDDASMEPEIRQQIDEFIRFQGSLTRAMQS